jgi:hypothetical protein
MELRNMALAVKLLSNAKGGQRLNLECGDMSPGSKARSCPRTPNQGIARRRVDRMI